jgi:hypothetical protein
MHASKQLCGLKNMKGNPKCPKLNELYFYLFNKHRNLATTHTANGDVDDTFKCFKKLVELDIIKLTK